MKKYYAILVTAILLIFGALGFYNEKHTLSPEEEAAFIKSMANIEKYMNEDHKQP